MSDVRILLQRCLIGFVILHVASSEQQNIRFKMKEIKKRLRDKLDFPWSENELTPYLMKSKRLANKGIINKGILSLQSIQRQLHKAIHGKNVSLYIFGESVSVGADLGKYNKEKVFHNILSYWWDSLFSGITNSKMLRRNLAVGGVGSSYFARCWQEYLTPGDTFDLAIWEFNINDVGDESLHSSLQLFTKSLYQRFKKLNLMFTVFFRRSLYDNQREKESSKRHELAENIVAVHAHKYNITCFNIEPLVNHSKVELGIDDMFRNMHPSAFAHTQMAFLIIQYYTDIITTTLDRWLSDGSYSILNPNIMLKNMFGSDNMEFCNSTCWTAVTPNYKKHIQAHSLFTLPVKRSKDSVVVTDGWKNVDEERYDVTGGYRASNKGSYVNLYFKVKKTADKRSRRLFIGLRYSSMESISRVELKTIKSHSTRIHNSTTIKPPKKDDGLKIYPLASVGPGLWKLSINVVKGDFLLCALIIC